MITLSNNTKCLALLHQVEEIYGKVYTNDSLLETVFYWGINCIEKSNVKLLCACIPKNTDKFVQNKAE